MRIRKAVTITSSFIMVILILGSVFLFFKARQTAEGREAIDALLSQKQYKNLGTIGTVNNLTVLPIIDFYTDNNELKTEPGVAYLIKADDTTILMDVGYNKGGEHPSPLMHNMQKMGVKISDIDMIFISHVHPDHVGGMSEMKKGEFSFSNGKVSIGALPVYAPEKCVPSSLNPGPQAKVIQEPTILKKGIVSLGSIPRFLYIMGRTEEQVLAINVKGKGIALIIGCGHPSIERILERSKMLFKEPVYAVIGGLHFPINGGRGNIGPINVQYVVGADRPFWNGLDEKDVVSAIDAIKGEKVSIISVSPHDSSDWAIDQFRNAFKRTYVDLKVGKEIRI